MTCTKTRLVLRLLDLRLSPSAGSFTMRLRMTLTHSIRLDKIKCLHLGRWMNLVVLILTLVSERARNLCHREPQEMGRINMTHPPSGKNGWVPTDFLYRSSLVRARAVYRREMCLKARFQVRLYRTAHSCDQSPKGAWMARPRRRPPGRRYAHLETNRCLFVDQEGRTETAFAASSSPWSVRDWLRDLGLDLYHCPPDLLECSVTTQLPLRMVKTCLRLEEALPPKVSVVVWVLVHP